MRKLTKKAHISCGIAYADKNFSFLDPTITVALYEPRCEKTGLRGF